MYAKIISMKNYLMKLSESAFCYCDKTLKPTCEGKVLFLLADYIPSSMEAKAITQET